jgi:hypothetical protein
VFFFGAHGNCIAIAVRLAHGHSRLALLENTGGTWRHDHRRGCRCALADGGVQATPRAVQMGKTFTLLRSIAAMRNSSAHSGCIA